MHRNGMGGPPNGNEMGIIKGAIAMATGYMVASIKVKKVLWARFKALAARRGQKIQFVVAEAMEQYLERAKATNGFYEE